MLQVQQKSCSSGCGGDGDYVDLGDDTYRKSPSNITLWLWSFRPLFIDNFMRSNIFDVIVVSSCCCCQYVHALQLFHSVLHCLMKIRLICDAAKLTGNSGL